MPAYCYLPEVLPKPEGFSTALKKPLVPALRDREQDLSDAIARLIAFSQERRPRTSATRALEEYIEAESSGPPEAGKLVVSGRNQKSRWRDAHWCVPKKK